ncbi:MAG: nucleotide exchange factor GrpE, partial [Candidatus Omnitrophica bacterium]|nr:nucleotide exchange factor GrpE [Candidatus Omnitrophota bacterium]
MTHEASGKKAPQPQAEKSASCAESKSTEESKNQELETLRQQAKEAQDKYLRTVAEFENTRKRLQREKEEFTKFAAQSLVRELLPIMDGLSQALVAVDKQSDPEAVVKGVHLIYRQLLGVLEEQGVKRISTIGELFDPHLHEAVDQVAATDGQAEGKIVEEVHTGYTMHDKVIRPAMVKVAKKQQTADS